MPASAINAYGYALNNPVNFTDPSGASALGWFGEVLVGVIAGAAAIAAAPFAIAAMGALGITAAAGSITAIALGAVGGAFFGAAAGALAGGIAGGVISMINGNSFGAGLGEGAGIGAISGAFAGGAAAARMAYSMGIGRPQTHIIMNRYQLRGKAYYKDGRSLYPDFNNPYHAQHFDVKIRGNPGEWRWYFNGTIEPKYSGPNVLPTLW